MGEEEIKSFTDYLQNAEVELLLETTNENPPIGQLAGQQKKVIVAINLDENNPAPSSQWKISLI